MEAIKEENPPKIPPTCTLEPDTREPGTALCPERRPLHKLLRIAKTIGSYFFAALFQQRPAPAEGGMFKTFPIVNAVPSNCTWVRYWDKAGTQGGKGARSAGVKMARTPSGEYIITHIVKGRWSAGEREKIIRETTEIDGIEVYQWVEQEPGSGGKESAENTVKNLEGFVCKIERVTGDKETRAQPMSAQTEIGNVKLLKGDWNQEFVDEARVFPNGRYKDQIDAAGGAFNKLALESRPIPGAAVAPIVAPAVPLASGHLPTIPQYGAMR
jgi:predicted phage terminase large subunit-like protein